MLLGIGVDILSLSRLEALVQRRGATRLAKRICCSRELAEFQALAGRDSHQSQSTRPLASTSMPDVFIHAHHAEGIMRNDGADIFNRQIRFLSSRWVIKEAAYKAISVIPGLTWKDIDLRYASSGRPEIALVGQPQHTGLCKIHLLGTISHDAGVVVGVVVAQEIPNK